MPCSTVEACRCWPVTAYVMQQDTCRSWGLAGMLLHLKPCSVIQPRQWALTHAVALGC